MQADSVLQSQCLSILKDDMRNPISYWFREPYRAEKAIMDDYLSKIPHPMDLSTIQDHLEKNEYANFECFANDMDLIFENAIVYNGPESLVGGIGIYLKNVVKKKIDEIRYQNPRNYEARLFELIRNVNKVLENPPKTMDIKVKASQEIHGIDEFNNVKIEQLVRALNTLLNDGKLPQIMEVLKKADENFKVQDNMQNDIDLALVSRKALHALEEFVKSSN